MLEKLLNGEGLELLRGGFAGFIARNWLELLIALLLVGFALDQAIYFARYRPWCNWMRTLRHGRRWIEKTFSVRLPWPPDVAPTPKAPAASTPRPPASRAALPAMPASPARAEMDTLGEPLFQPLEPRPQRRGAPGERRVVEDAAPRVVREPGGRPPLVLDPATRPAAQGPGNRPAPRSPAAPPQGRPQSPQGRTPAASRPSSTQRPAPARPAAPIRQSATQRPAPGRDSRPVPAEREPATRGKPPQPGSPAAPVARERDGRTPGAPVRPSPAAPARGEPVTRGQQPQRPGPAPSGREPQGAGAPRPAWPRPPAPPPDYRLPPVRPLPPTDAEREQERQVLGDGPKLPPS